MTYEQARAAVLSLVGTGVDAEALELSLREALALKHHFIGTEHILLGLVREGDGVAAQVLRDLAPDTDLRRLVGDRLRDVS